MEKILQKNIDEIMRDFDFDKVHRFAKENTVEALKTEALRLLQAATELQVGDWVASGGFFAERRPDGNMRLLFAIDEIETENLYESSLKPQ